VTRELCCDRLIGNRRAAMNRRLSITLLTLPSILTLLSILVAFTTAVPAQTPTDGPLARDKFLGPPTAEPGSRDWLKAIEGAQHERLADMSRTDNCPHSFDVLHYDIALNIDFDLQVLAGDTHVRAVSETEGLATIDLDLTVLTVASVTSAGQPLSFTHNDPILSIDLGQAYAVGDTFEIDVFYGGHPGNEGPGGFGGFWFAGSPLMAFQMGVGLEADPPSMGKYWFPCWDWPCDKATADYHITVPEGRTAVCNGVLVATENDVRARTTTFHWSETHPIAPHVMSVAARLYTELVDPTYDWIHYWVFPEQAGNAPIHFGNVDVMMDAFIDRYGPYPFSKFGYAAATIGDMEHQTCVTHASYLIGPQHTYDWLLAHEMSHQWWGDCVAINDWRDVWLSEGFATYSEAIFMEYAYGFTSYRNYMVSSLMNPVLNSSESFPIYDPEYLWGTTVYEKGGTVLHMLRHVVGDDTFFDALAAYRQAYEHGNAVTAQFQEVVETVSGRDLDWFFDEWIYDLGWPNYRYAWQAFPAPGGYRVDLIIAQVQSVGPTFTMPVDVRLAYAAGDTLITLWVDEAFKTFTFTLPSQPVSVQLDPDNWILKHAQETSIGAVAEKPDAGSGVGTPDLWLAAGVPNPVRGGFTLSYSAAHGQHLRAEIFDICGQRVATLADAAVPAGSGTLAWNGLGAGGGRAPAGVYYLRLAAAGGAFTRRVVLVW
jgi:aminopeptidase N